MEDSVVGQAIYKVSLDFSGITPQVKQIEGIVSSSMQGGTRATNSLTEGMAQLTLGVNALKQSFDGLKSAKAVINELTDSYNQYQASMNGVASVARATGQSVSESMGIIKEVTNDGLLSKTDAAAAIKNLELYGYTAQQASEMIQIMTDAAVYNRQANYSVSEAVRVTTEGIRMENSVLSDASGVTKNIAQMYADYAAQLGKSTTALTQAEKVQAVYNGFLAEGGAFAGDAESYTETLAGSQDKLATSIETLKGNLGGLFDEYAPVINGIADWINNNQALVAGIVTFVGVLAAGGGLIWAISSAKKAIIAIRSAMTTLGLVSKAATGGIIGLGIAIAAIAGAYAASKVLNNLADSEEQLEEDTGGANTQLARQQVQVDKTAEKVAKLNSQINKLTRDYQRDLKQIAVNHEENLLSLNRQIEEANVDYRRAIDERMADFNVTLAKQERSHQETVDELMGQLSFLQRYNNIYNRQKLAQVEFALAKEQQLYQRETETQKAEIELQNAADKAKLDQKLASLQQELDDEVAFMNKHRNELNSVRDVILLDEIESLNERYQEQKKDYERQIADARSSGIDAANSFDAGWNSAKETLTPDVASNLGEEGAFAAQSWTEGFRNWVGQGGIVADIWKLILGEDTYRKWTGQTTYKSDAKFAQASMNAVNALKRGYSSGGYTGRGPVDEVAGVVHRGEYVIPANQVNQSTGEPKINGTTQNITINLSGVFATSQAERRRVAEQIIGALGQVNQARLS